MQFDDFDKKIKEAAEHHHPAYEEKAWDKMEKLLDKHLPNEKEDKRRIFLLLLLLLLTGAGIYLAIAKPWQSKSDFSDQINTVVKQKSPANLTKEAESKTDNNIATPETREPGSADAAAKVANDKITTSKKNEVGGPESNHENLVDENRNNRGTNISEKGKPLKLKDVKPNSQIIKRKRTEAIANKEVAAGVLVNNHPAKHRNSNADDSQNVSADKSQNTTEGNATLQNINSANTVNTPKPGLDNTAISANIPASANTSNPDSVLPKKLDAVAKIGQEKKNPVPEKKEKQKTGRQKRTSFAITFTAGPDLSTVGLSEIGKVKLSYGAGFSYSLDRFTLRSGFYIAKKVYSAGPDEYHPPEHYWTYYVDLNKVDADCKLYEIPVTFSYNFSQSKTHNWFASAGLSTYLMKKEKYDYYYKNPVTQVDYYKSWTLKNGSKHVFSIINLSAGYERKLSNKLSLIAEPYIKIPMEGIGFGSIKLNSAGVLFTLSVKPFATKK